VKIAYIDPGLSTRKGHNASMVCEFDEALVRERGHTLRVLCGAGLDRRWFQDLHADLRPVFRIDGYARPGLGDLADPRLQTLLDAVVADLNSGGIDDCDAVLMPTTYPLHLRALAKLAPRLRKRRLVAGMLLPSEFWSADADGARRIDSLFIDSIDALSADCDFLAYSETGTFRCGAQVVPLATMLPPLATSSANQVQELAHASARPNGSESQVIGFFGSPFVTKGFTLMVEAVHRLARTGAGPANRLCIRLPHGHEDLCSKLNQMAPWVDAQSRQTTNGEYLTEMSRVDAVWALYDPQEYRHKMSGIVPEAICLGKPLLIAEGCEAIHDFLERHAPGSFIAGSYAADTIGAVLDLDRAHWSHPSRCAAAHAPLARQLKSMDRYLAVCGVN